MADVVHLVFDMSVLALYIRYAEVAKKFFFETWHWGCRFLLVVWGSGQHLLYHDWIFRMPECFFETWHYWQRLSFFADGLGFCSIHCTMTEPFVSSKFHMFRIATWLMASSASTLRKRKEPASDEGPCQRPHPSEQQIPCKKPVSWSGLWYGSDCSGLDAGAFALKRLSSEFRHWFGSESHEPYRRVFSTLHPTCETVFSDAQRKPLNDLQKERKSSRNSTKAMVYTAGFPC